MIEYMEQLLHQEHQGKLVFLSIRWPDLWNHAWRRWTKLQSVSASFKRQTRNIKWSKAEKTQRKSKERWIYTPSVVKLQKSLPPNAVDLRSLCGFNRQLGKVQRKHLWEFIIFKLQISISGPGSVLATNPERLEEQYGAATLRSRALPYTAPLRWSWQRGSGLNAHLRSMASLMV